MEAGAGIGVVFLLFFLVSALFSLGCLALWLWMLIDCLTKEPAEGNDKLVWILVIVLVGPLGALIYLLARRPKRIAEHGQ